MKLIKKNGEILELTVQEYKELYNEVPPISNWTYTPIYTDPPKWGDNHVTAKWN